MSIYTNCTLFLHSPVLQSANINRSEVVTENKNVKINSCENKLIYSIPLAKEAAWVLNLLYTSISKHHAICLHKDIDFDYLC